MSRETKNMIDFSVFVINKLAAAWHMSTPEVYAILDKGNIVNGYIYPCYDTLHTLGAEYLISDITELAQERGVLV